MIHQLKVYYSVENCGDGSAYPRFSLSKELADIHQELHNQDCGWAEDCVGSILLESDSPITLVEDNQITKKSLLEYSGEDEELIKRINEVN